MMFLCIVSFVQAAATSGDHVLPTVLVHLIVDALVVILLLPALTAYRNPQPSPFVLRWYPYMEACAVFWFWISVVAIKPVLVCRHDITLCAILKGSNGAIPGWFGAVHASLSFVIPTVRGCTCRTVCLPHPQCCVWRQFTALHLCGLLLCVVSTSLSPAHVYATSIGDCELRSSSGARHRQSRHRCGSECSLDYVHSVRIARTLNSACHSFFDIPDVGIESRLMGEVVAVAIIQASVTSSVVRALLSERRVAEQHDVRGDSGGVVACYVAPWFGAHRPLVACCDRNLYKSYMTKPRHKIAHTTTSASALHLLQSRRRSRSSWALSVTSCVLLCMH